MNKKTIIWTLALAVPVGVAALLAGYFYKSGVLPNRDAGETAPIAETKSDGPALPAASGGKTVSSDPTAAQSAAGEPQQAAALPEGQAADKAGDNQEASAEEAPLQGPSFDVVGVEPTGETVVAGRSDAGAIIALTANGEVVGKSIANEAGEWTIILAEPLKPGDYDVGLEVHNEQGGTVEESEQRLAVSVPEGGKEQPLVVLNDPEGPSDILQKPEPEPEKVAEMSDGQTGQQQVASTPDTQNAPTGGPTQETVVAALPETSADDAQDASAQSNTANGAQEQVATPAPAAQQDQTAGVSSVGAPSDGAPSDGALAPQTAAASDASTIQENAPGEAPKITVEAVESEPDKVYVAGTGEPGASVRVYVGEEFQGEATVDAGGKWLLEGAKNVSEGDVEVRADLIGKDGNEVDARAAVTFEKERDQQIVLTKVVAQGAGAQAGDQDAEVKKALPVVIIRKGDNLWRISRRLYGDGFRYTTIYKANQDQIRDPDLIYPGQVFLTPEGDLNWPSPEKEPG